MSELTATPSLAGMAPLRIEELLRLDAESTAVLAANRVPLPPSVALAELLADSHMRAPVANQAHLHATIQQRHPADLGNLTQLIADLPQTELHNELERLIDWIHDSACSLAESLQRRVESGCVRECRWDLQAANIVRRQGRLTPFGCIDYGPQQRWIDVMEHLALLVMDLASYGRMDLAFALLSRYLEITGDYDGVPLLRFYAAHHTLFRTEVDTRAAVQLPSPAADELNARLRRRVSAAATWITPPARPYLVLMHGPSGSGKSWLSERLVPRLSAIRLRSDLERKRLAGITPQLRTNAGLGLGLDSTACPHRTYERLADCADHCLQAGLNTIVDATFLHPADRELFRQLAARRGAACVILSCRCDPATLFRHRYRSRARPQLSDADLVVLAAQLNTLPPLSASERANVIEIDTSDTNAVPQVLASIGTTGLGTFVKPAIERCSA